MMGQEGMDCLIYNDKLVIFPTICNLPNSRNKYTFCVSGSTDMSPAHMETKVASDITPFQSNSVSPGVIAIAICSTPTLRGQKANVTQESILWAKKEMGPA
jgi:hypothetical protein